MRYIDLEGTHIRSIDVTGYRNNYEGSYKKSTYQMSINKGRTATTQGVHAKLRKMKNERVILIKEKKR